MGKKLDLFNDYCKRGYIFDTELVSGDYDGLCILKAYIVDYNGYRKKRIPGTTIYQVWDSMDYAESVDFDTLKEARQYWIESVIDR